MEKVRQRRSTEEGLMEKVQWRRFNGEGPPEKRRSIREEKVRRRSPMEKGAAEKRAVGKENMKKDSTHGSDTM